MSALDVLGSFWGPERVREGGCIVPPRLVSFRMTGVGGPTDDRRMSFFLVSVSFLCFLSTTFARLPLGTRFLELSYVLKVLPQRFRRYFVAFFLRLVAPFFLSGWVGFPLPRFSLPLPLWRFFLLGGWVPLAVFSPCFPRGSWVGGGAILSVLFFPAISCILHLSPCRLR